MEADQSRSPLLGRLPAEIRLMIYEFYTLDHLSNAQSHRNSGSREYTAYSETPFPQGYRDRAYLWRVPLLQTCKFVARELRPLLRAEALLTIHSTSWELPTTYRSYMRLSYFTFSAAAQCQVMAVRRLRVRIIVAPDQRPKLKRIVLRTHVDGVLDNICRHSMGAMRQLEVELHIQHDAHIRKTAPSKDSWEAMETKLDSIMNKVLPNLEGLRCLQFFGDFRKQWLDRAERLVPDNVRIRHS